MNAIDFYTSERTSDEPRHNPPSSAAVDALNERAFLLKTIDPARAIILTEDAEQAASVLNYTAGVAMAMAIRAYALVQIDDCFAARRCGEIALPLCEASESYRGGGCAFFGIANGQMDAGDLENALETGYRALRMFEHSGDKEAVANVFLTISLIYGMLDNIERAEQYALHSLSLYRDLGNRGGEWILLNNLAYNYLLWGDLPTAKRFGTEALTVHHQLLATGQPYPFQNGVGTFYHTLAEIALTENNLVQAEAYLMHSLALLGNATPHTLLLHHHLFFTLGRVLHRRGAYAAARETFVTTLWRTTRQGFRPLATEIQEALSHLYDSMGQPRRALHYYRRFHRNDKTRYYEQLASKMRRLEVKYVLEAAQREKEILAEKNRQIELAYEELKVAHGQIQELSIRDSLTHLHNRRYFEEAATRLFDDCLQQDQPFALLLLDVDDFKQVNDRFLHHAGDQVLIVIASLLQSYQRDTSVVARIGGEEFVIALPDTVLEEAIQIGEALREEIYTYAWHSIHPDLKVSVSIGVAGQEQSATLSQQMVQADRHLYLAKHGGKNQVSIGRFVIVK